MLIVENNIYKYNLKSVSAHRIALKNTYGNSFPGRRSAGGFCHWKIPCREEVAGNSRTGA